MEQVDADDVFAGETIVKVKCPVSIATWEESDKITWETEIVLKIRNRMFWYLPVARMIPSGGSIRPHGGISWLK